MRLTLFLSISIFIVFHASPGCTARISSMNERLAATHAESTSRCLSKAAHRFVNATLIVLSAEDEIEEQRTSLNETDYVRLMARFMTHVTQSMSSGMSFCSAVGRACHGLVGEWTRSRLPAPERDYRTHCENVMRATDEAREYLLVAPAYRNPLYKCLRSALHVKPPDLE